MDISAYQHMNIRMSTRGKRPLRNLTPSDKVHAIQRIHNGETKASVSRDIGVPESTLRGWCKNEQKLRFMCRQLGTSDQISHIGVLENPPEKRTKFDLSHVTGQKFSNAGNFEDYGYNRLSLGSIDFTANNNNNTSNNSNPILEKIAFNEFIKKNTKSLQSEGSKQFSGIISTHQSPMSATSHMPLSATDYSQLSMMQNLSLFSLLNPNFIAMSGLSPVSSIDGGVNKSKVPAHNSNPTIAINDNLSDNAKNSSLSILSVKNWAKDPSENTPPNNINNNNNINNSNDNNNNVDVKLKQTVLPLVSIPEIGSFPPLFSTADLTQISNPSVDLESNNNPQAVLEWYKIFNASLHFLGLAAAVAAMQQSQTVPQPSTIAVTDMENAFIKTEIEREHTGAENILYKQLTKAAHTYQESDLSTDSYYGSEPEDLSVRSTTSKISSPTNSRSQSPDKSATSSSSTQHHSDTEQ